MKVTIDKNSGYCFGVEYAIEMAEAELEESENLYCLGDIVHNDMEVKRLHQKGLRIISREDLIKLTDCKVLIRAHGEPPETYQIALKNNIELIDASCPVVLKLQNRIKNAYNDTVTQKKGQIVIYGKEGHAEIIGLNGQLNNEGVIISSESDLDKIDFSKPIELFSQTTKSTEGFYHIKSKIEERIKNSPNPEQYFEANDSICRQVSNREPQLTIFSNQHNVILFVSGKKSSNGKALYEVCKKNNSKTYFIENETEIDINWFEQNSTVGICGATSTPNWLMQQVADFVEKIYDLEVF
ncbi:MAG: 4-hydroxy-3-methylbut-2-enyl diphosphate reductase [Bacteroidetes bacterium]|nr:MAG: 4-hydroxy-3-methylbut-2-enyl diphosphate reductase [Bacteroidota bacterium]TAG88220.1 MAG: 4-hydroxy-3-methylbut-2-enyl diphosphate reductase [Bacteroidota bacterium]